MISDNERKREKEVCFVSKLCEVKATQTHAHRLKMTQAGVKLLKTLRQILCILNALLTISAVIQIVDLITQISLKSKPKRKIPKRLPSVIGKDLTLWTLSSVNNASLSTGSSSSSSSSTTTTTSSSSSSAVAAAAASTSSVSFAFLAGDIAILAITVIIGWIALVTFKRKLLHTYLILMIIDMLFTVAIIIRDASTGSWLIMCDINLAINISTLIVLYFLYKELAKTSLVNNLPGNNVLTGVDVTSLPRVHSNLDAFSSLTVPASSSAAAVAALANTHDSIDDSSTDISTLASYLHHRRATIWSNGSLICETNLPASTYWDTSVCLTVAPLPYTIGPGEPPPPWSPPMHASIDPVSRDTNNNSHLNNFNLNPSHPYDVAPPPDEHETCNNPQSSSTSSSSSSSHTSESATASEQTLTPSHQVSSV